MLPAVVRPRRTSDARALVLTACTRSNTGVSLKSAPATTCNMLSGSLVPMPSLFSARTSPFTCKLAAGALVPMPTLPPLVMRTRSMTLVSPRFVLKMRADRLSRSSRSVTMAAAPTARGPSAIWNVRPPPRPGSISAAVVRPRRMSDTREAPFVPCTRSNTGMSSQAIPAATCNVLSGLLVPIPTSPSPSTCIPRTVSANGDDSSRSRGSSSGSPPNLMPTQALVPSVLRASARLAAVPPLRLLPSFVV